MFISSGKDIDVISLPAGEGVVAGAAVKNIVRVLSVESVITLASAEDIVIAAAYEVIAPFIAVEDVLSCIAINIIVAFIAAHGSILKRICKKTIIEYRALDDRSARRFDLPSGIFVVEFKGGG